MALSEERKKKIRTLRKRISRVQAVVGIAAGIVSVGGFVYSFLVPSAPGVAQGNLVTVVQDARSKKPLGDVTVEILTDGDAVVTTISIPAAGHAQQRLKEGGYKLRVSHPRFATETRKVHVLAGQTAEVRVALSPRAGPVGSTSPASPGQAVDQGVGAMKRFFRELGK